MFRSTDILMIAVMVSAAAFTYKTKHDAERRYEALARIRAEIRHEADTITLLRADWSLLTQPARLQRLAEVYKSELRLQPVESHQIVEIGDLPTVPVDLDGTASRALGGMAGADKTITGGTRR
jgi:hypothetical protein